MPGLWGSWEGCGARGRWSGSAGGLRAVVEWGRELRFREETVLSEYVQFVGAMVLMVAFLIGSYWFVLYAPGSPGRRQRERQAERARGPERR